MKITSSATSRTFRWVRWLTLFIIRNAWSSSTLRDDINTPIADSNNGVTGSRRAAGQADPAAEHRLVARLTDALERADVDALIELLVADVKVSMPPVVLEYRGIESTRQLFTTVSFRPGRTYRVVPTRANGQPAFGLYLADAQADVYRAYVLLVIAASGERVTEMTAFTADVMTRFGLPRTLPESDRREAGFDA